MTRLLSAVLGSCFVSLAGCSPAAPPPPANAPPAHKVEGPACEIPPAGRIHSFARSSESLKVDRVGGGDGALVPNGQMDGAFDAVLEGPITAIFIASTDSAGTAIGQQWDTIVGLGEMPAALRGPFLAGSSTAGLGVWEGGKFVNRPDGSIELPAGKHTVTLYAADSGWFREGNHFRVMVAFPDGCVAKGPVVPY
jgi:hypothetical protein